MLMLIRPTSLYFAMTCAWPWVKATVRAVAPASLVPMNCVSTSSVTLTWRVPVPGFKYPDQNCSPLAPS